MYWKTLDKDRKYRTTSEGVTIIKPKKKIRILPAQCPVCDVLFSSSLDLEAYSNSECCAYCETNYAYVDRESWLKGERPSREIVEKDLRSRKMSTIDLKF